MDDDGWKARVTATANQQLLTALLVALEAADILTTDDLKVIFHGALVGTEAAAQTELNRAVRQHLEKLQNAIISPLTKPQ